MDDCRRNDHVPTTDNFSPKIIHFRSHQNLENQNNESMRKFGKPNCSHFLGKDCVILQIIDDHSVR